MEMKKSIGDRDEHEWQITEEKIKTAVEGLKNRTTPNEILAEIIKKREMLD